jgi:hypothetical protein
MAARKQGKRRQFTAARRETFLEDLRRTGNHASASRAAEMTDGGARRYRKRRPEFEALCIEAEREAQRRLGGAEGPFDGCNEAAFESIRRGSDGRLKIQALGKRRWSKRTEEIFFGVLRESGNISAGARAAGVTRRTIWLRRREWPAFARRFDETMEEAEIVLEFRVACLGTNWSEDAELGDEAEWDEEAEAEADATAAAAFDPELALRFLKWRAEQKRGKAGPGAALPSAEDVRERIARSIAALRRHKERDEARRRAEGDGA